MDEIPINADPKKKLIVCIYLHAGECILNKYKQCEKGFKYTCFNCNYGLESMYDKCEVEECINQRNSREANSKEKAFIANSKF
jgi:hypothetical protein